MKTRRNPAFRPVEYQVPKFAEPKAPKVDPESGLPWRMYEQAFPTLCKNHRPPVMMDASFVVARSRASADAVFARGNGLCASCMCMALLKPNVRIRDLEGGHPNPLRSVHPPGVTARAPRNVSPYRLFRFDYPKDKAIRDACGKLRWQFYVIAVDPQEAARRVNRYGMCALCICQ